MKKHLLSITLILVSCVFLLSCKGDDGEVGPAGPAGPAGTSNPNQNFVSKEGFARGTATGTLLSGTAYSYAFDFQGIWDNSDNSYKVLSPTETEIQISKSFAGDGTTFIYGNFDLGITVTSLADLTTPQVDNVYFNFEKDLGNNKIHQGYGSYYSSSPGSATVSGLVYNSTTGVLTGNYTLTMPANSNYGSLSITNGTFSTKLSQRVSRKAAQ